MAKYERAEEGSICLIQEKDGRIVQIALTEGKHKLLQVFLASISTPEEPLVQMGEDLDLILKRDLCKKCNPNKK